MNDQIDDWGDRLRGSLRSERRAWQRGLWFWFAVFAVLSAGYFWWIYPRPQPPRWLPVAYDTFTPEKEPIVRTARLVPEETPLADFRPEREIVEFADAGSNAKVQSDASGLAKFTTQPSEKSGDRLFVVRWPGDARRAGATDEAREFVRPADTRLVLVEIDGALAEKLIQSGPRGILSVPIREGAVETLQALAKRGLQVVYLATGSTNPLDDHVQRRWIVARPELPAGPVLADPERIGWPKVLEQLRTKFPGEHWTIRPSDANGLMIARGVSTPATMIGHWKDIPSILQAPG